MSISFSFILCAPEHSPISSHLVVDTFNYNKAVKTFTETFIVLRQWIWIFHTLVGLGVGIPDNVLRLHVCKKTVLPWGSCVTTTTQRISRYCTKYSLSIVWFLLHHDPLEEGPDFVPVSQMRPTDLQGLSTLLEVTQSVNSRARIQFSIWLTHKCIV